LPLQNLNLFGGFAKVLGIFVLLATTSKGFRLTKLVPIDSNDVMAAIISILFVLLVFAVYGRFEACVG
jgi:hypothetical protein